MIPRPTGPAVPFTLERAASRARSIERARGLRGPVERTGCGIHAPDRSEQDGKQREPRMSRTPTRPARARPRVDHDARRGWRGCGDAPGLWASQLAAFTGMRPPRFRCRRRRSDCEVTARTRRATSDPCACPDGARQLREPEPSCASKEQARPVVLVPVVAPGPPPGPGQENRDLRTFFFQIKKLDVWSWGATARHGTARHGTARRRRERHRSAPHALARSVLARCWLEAAGRASRTDGQGAREAATPHAARRTPHAARRTPHAGQTPEPGAQTRSKALDAQEPGAARRAGVTV